MGPKSNDKCPLRRKAEAGFEIEQKKMQKRGRGHMTMKEGLVVVQPEPRTPEPPKARRDSRGVAFHLDFYFQPTVKEKSSTYF